MCIVLTIDHFQYITIFNSRPIIFCFWTVMLLRMAKNVCPVITGNFPTAVRIAAIAQ